MSNTNSQPGPGSKSIEITTQSPDVKKPIEKLTGPLMVLIGFGIVLYIGYVLFPGWLYAEESQPLQFNHAIHMGDEAGMSCEDCHGFRDDGTFVGIPPVASCADCHEEPLGDSQAEKILIEEYIKPGKEVPWLVYSKQPDNAYFTHVSHVKSANIPCAHCHGKHGETDSLRPFERNVITGYSRDIWGSAIAGIKTNSWDRMKMDDCANCHIEHGFEDNCMTCHK